MQRPEHVQHIARREGRSHVARASADAHRTVVSNGPLIIDDVLQSDRCARNQQDVTIAYVHAHCSHESRCVLNAFPACADPAAMRASSRGAPNPFYKRVPRIARSRITRIAHRASRASRVVRNAPTVGAIARISPCGHARCDIHAPPLWRTAIILQSRRCVPRDAPRGDTASPAGNS
ncbi:hypothetical protein [Burkholderia vietnamiensis]|uniref:hypothetical protein n=1 Tax=Burkholderia vietnamiensis TaxID=60552 RepID=UPI001593635A|nr:hypothetical protein [Burkholderia vietnamiensis]HDR8973833.1 hypothetical protein [Burkholderia vietnamiensis]HDR9222809.1 hypothetical protein [Burkholderia vietnamiensis]